MVRPEERDKYYLRMLLLHAMGAISFQKLRTDKIESTKPTTMHVWHLNSFKVRESGSLRLARRTDHVLFLLLIQSSLDSFCTQKSSFVRHKVQMSFISVTIYRWFTLNEDIILFIESLILKIHCKA